MAFLLEFPQRRIRGAFAYYPGMADPHTKREAQARGPRSRFGLVWINFVGELISQNPRAARTSSKSRRW
jgi:hypothetical protein